jgi:hypothetical protein
MTHRKGAVWTERLVLALILASLAGTLNLVLTIHRRVISTAIASKPPDNPPPSLPVVSVTPQIAHPAPSPPPTVQKSVPAPVQAPPPPKSVEDPTAPILARMDRAIAREADAARESDRRTRAMEAARHISVAESERWKRREMLVRQQVATLSRKADKLEQDALTIEAERDVLARERDALKAALVRGSQRSGYAVLPYKGPNGTWRRPIVLECSGNTVKLQPHGPSFSMMELSPLIHPRSSPVVHAIAKEMLQIQGAETPDGAPAVPYLVFLVRPDGIRPYYQARARLEPLGIAFGYELIEQDLAVDIPDFNDVRTWDGTVPLDMPEIAGGDSKTRQSWPPSPEAPDRDASRGSPPWPGGDRTASTDASGSDTGSKPGAERRWPDLARGDGSRRGAQGGSDPSGRGMDEASTPGIDLGEGGLRGDRDERGQTDGSGDASPDAFVWPTGSGDARPTGTGHRGRDRKGWGSAESAGMGNGLAGTPTGALTGTGSPAPSDSPGSAGGRPGGGAFLPGGSPEGGLQGRGPALRGSGDSALEARPSGSGRAGESSPGDGATRGRTSTDRGSGAGSDPEDGDGLPSLEPARDGSSPSGAPMSGATRDAGPFGGAGAGRTGSGRSAMGGSAPGAPGGDGRPLRSAPGQPGNSTISVRRNGQATPDPGVSPDAGGGSEPVKDSPGSGLSSDGGPPTLGGTNRLTPSGFAGTTDAGQGAVSDGDPPGTGVSSGAAGSPRASGRSNPIASSSSTASGRRSAGSNASSGSIPILGTPAPADAGLPPTPLEAALGSRSSASGSSASANGLGASGTMDGSSAGSASAMSGEFAGTNAVSDGQSSTRPPSSMTAGASGLSLPGLSSSADADSEPDALKGLSLPPIDTHRQPGAIDVPFEITVVCRRDDLLLHPGGYRITTQALQAGAGKGDNTDSLLQRELRAIVRRRAQVDPLIRPKPRVKFLVETAGGTTFWTARKQLTFSGLDWPMTVQVAGPPAGDLLGERTVR